MIPSRVKPKEEPVETIELSKNEPYKPGKSRNESPKRIDPSPPKRIDPSPPTKEKSLSPPKNEKKYVPYDSYDQDPYEEIKRDKASKPKDEYKSPKNDVYDSRKRSPSPERSPRVNEYRSRDRSPERDRRDNYDSYKGNSFEFDETPKRATKEQPKEDTKPYDSYERKESPPRTSSRLNRPSEKRQAYDSIPKANDERPTEVKAVFKKKTEPEPIESYLEAPKANQPKQVQSQTMFKKEDPIKILEQNLLIVALKRMVKNQQSLIQDLKDDKADLIEENNELALEVKELNQKIENLEVMGKLNDFDEDNANKVDVAHMDEKLDNINNYLDSIKYDPKQNKLMEEIIKKNKNYSDLSEENSRAMGKLKNNISALKKTLQDLNIGD